jgi:hypothetical protein
MRANSTAGAGLPLLCEKSFGKGRILAFACGSDRDWTNFPVRPAYLPWVYRLVAYLAQSPAAGAGFYATGDLVPLPVSAAEGVGPLLVKRPDGTVTSGVTTDDPQIPLAFDQTDQQGVYTVLAPNSRTPKEGEAPGALFVANLENYEADLTWLDHTLEAEGPEDSAIGDGLKRLLPGRPQVSWVPEPALVGEASLAARRGLPLWNLFLAVVLAIALFEPWLANWISRKHYARPKEIAAPAVALTGRVAALGARPQASLVEEVAS